MEKPSRRREKKAVLRQTAQHKVPRERSRLSMLTAIGVCPSDNSFTLLNHMKKSAHSLSNFEPSLAAAWRCSQTICNSNECRGISVSSNYKAFAVTASGRYEIVSRPVPTPGSGQVLVRVLACGICRMDLELFQGTLPAGIYPRVPGHEVIGIIESLGPDVGGWRVGQQVGCGFFGGQCGVCAACRMGNFIHCHTLIQTGVTRDGGFAEVMLAETRALLLVPQDTPATILAPLFSAGVNVYCALRSGVARPGEIVAVHGLDGIGKLGLQFASKMGLQTLSIANGNTMPRQLCASEHTPS